MDSCLPSARVTMVAVPPSGFAQNLRAGIPAHAGFPGQASASVVFVEGFDAVAQRVIGTPQRVSLVFGRGAVAVGVDDGTSGVTMELIAPLQEVATAGFLRMRSEPFIRFLVV